MTTVGSPSYLHIKSERVSSRCRFSRLQHKTWSAQSISPCALSTALLGHTSTDLVYHDAAKRYLKHTLECLALNDLKRCCAGRDKKHLSLQELLCIKIYSDEITVHLQHS